MKVFLPLLVVMCLATSAISQEQTAAFGTIAEDSSQPINAEADRMEVDELTGIITMYDDVVITQGNTKLTAEFVEIFQNMELSEIETVNAKGSVYLESSGDLATGDEVTYDVKARMLYLTGNAFLQKVDNTISAPYIEVNTQTGSASMNGRVSTTLLPGGSSSEQ